ncbi:hypothetical protein B0H14DRAFT_3897789 [Mycena olivaceomarginata]|nr:hypothetical protein B0H14DRAFT_3897789 [Mycena olivaceomarginata]
MHPSITFLSPSHVNTLDCSRLLLLLEPFRALPGSYASSSSRPRKPRCSDSALALEPSLRSAPVVGVRVDVLLFADACVWEASGAGDATRYRDDDVGGRGRRAPALPLAVVSLAMMSLAITNAVDSQTCEGMGRGIASAAAVSAPVERRCRAALGIRGRVPNVQWDAGGPSCMHACDTARNN